jgi:hypothetical protein
MSAVHLERETAERHAPPADHSSSAATYCCAGTADPSSEDMLLLFVAVLLDYGGAMCGEVGVFVEGYGRGCVSPRGTDRRSSVVFRRRCLFQSGQVNVELRSRVRCSARMGSRFIWKIVPSRLISRRLHAQKWDGFQGCCTSSSTNTRQRQRPRASARIQCPPQCAFRIVSGI